MSCQEMRNHIIRVARNFQNLGMQRGDVVCMVAKNSQYVAAVVVGGLLIGLTISSLDPFFTIIEMTHALSLAEPKLIFCDEENVAIVNETLKSLHMQTEVYVLTEDKHTVPGFKTVFELLQPNEEENSFM
jgi:4-coumarate--CoA ligase